MDEKLPQYSPTVYRSAWVWVKFELADPFTLVNKKSRSWECYQVTLNSTQLIISKREEDGVNYNYTPSYLWGDTISSLTETSLSNPTPPNIPLSAIVARFTLQYAQIGLANDYFKRSNVIRIRAESQQFLIQCSSLEECVNWIHSIQMGIDISLDLSDRKDIEMNDLTRTPRPSMSRLTPNTTPLSTEITQSPASTTNQSGHSNSSSHRFHSFHFGHHKNSTKISPPTNGQRSSFKFHSRRCRKAATEVTPNTSQESISYSASSCQNPSRPSQSSSKPLASFASTKISSQPITPGKTSPKAISKSIYTKESPLASQPSVSMRNNRSTDAFKQLKRLGATSRWSNEVVVGAHDELFLVDEQNKVLKPIWTKIIYDT
ncbi:hypothetical protein NADFUDRAFT_83121 [Nadsonia fulvescens var. elongata DSM 6958]|uniref:PH domain-containing protein n=1 Tax=Nadsonia fulvescens var. elongata DSM 6958 TaxID=857566 RepID=A0A1E3PHW3_9ASCO|nr:hypothetical protein NADFUDRAFT_83121 [Nadsonia fulvescens var. elongata DSM 6958]